MVFDVPAVCIGFDWCTHLQTIIPGATPQCPITLNCLAVSRHLDVSIDWLFFSTPEVSFHKKNLVPRKLSTLSGRTQCFQSLSFLESRAIPIHYTQSFSLTPSGDWDGTDGAWSTFMIRVGTPAQPFRVLPLTSGTEAWIPIPDNCNAGISWRGNARGVGPFNGAEAYPFSGTPNDRTVSTIDAGATCTATKSPMCVDCLSINCECTNGLCTGR